MGSEEWRQQTRGRRRGGRSSGRAGGETKPPLADWCDTNLTAARFAKLAWLVQKQKATAAVVAILKKHQEQATPLSKVRQGVLERELDGAGDWGTATAPAGPTRSPKTGKQLAASLAERADVRGPPRQRGRSGGRAPEGRVRTGSRAQGGRKKQRPGAAPTAAASMAAAADVPVEAEDEVPSAVAGWGCACCLTLHRSLTRKCRVCLRPRVAPAASAAPPAVLSGEEIAAKRAKMMECIASMVEHGAMPDAVADLQAKVALLSKPVAAPPLPDLVAMLAAATAADVEAQVYLAALLDRGGELAARLAEAAADVEAHGIAVVKAHEQGKAVAAQMDEVKRAIAQGSASGPAGSCDAPAVPAQAAVLETVRCNVNAVFAQVANAWTSPDSVVLQEFREQLAKAGEPDTATAAAQLFAFYFEKLHLNLTTTAAESASAPAAPKAPSVRPTAATTMSGAASDAMLTARVPVKLAAQAQASVTQTAKLAAAGKQRVGLRQQGLDVLREPDELSDNGSSG